MKIYVVVTGENAITVSLNGEAAVAKTVKPTLTALGNGKIRFQCDGIDEEVETYRNIFINAVPLKGSWIAEEDYLSVTLFEAIMNKTFTASSSPGGSSVESVAAGDASIIIGGTATDPTIRQGLKYAMIFVTQAGENAPTGQIAFNTTGLAFTYQRDAEGQYKIFYTPEIDFTKVFVACQFYEDNGDGDAGQATIDLVDEAKIGYMTSTGNLLNGVPAEQQGTVMFFITLVA